MKKNFILSAFVALMGLVSCDKFLDTMPDNRAEVNTVSKIRALLVSGYPTNTYLTFNEYMSDNVDNFSDDNPGTSRFMDQLYSWQDVTEESNDSPKFFWSESYLCIAHANQALDAIYTLAGCDGLDEDAIVAAGLQAEMAEALLIRAYNHFMLVNEFCLNYNSQTSSSDLGIPYMEQVEQELNPKYDRGNVAEVYEKIEKDLELGLKYVSDAYYKVPKYHFNTRAAYAFAARFYLFYEKWDKAAESATKCLGSQPATLLRDWSGLSKLERDWDVRSYEFVKSSYDANLLMLTGYSAFGYYYSGYVGITKYGHNSYLCFNEGAYAANVWGNTETGWRNVSGWFYCPLEWYSGSNFDHLVTLKIPYMFEYTDPVARIGYAHCVSPALTADETLLTRAEAYVMMGQYDLATADINTYIHSIIRPNYFSKDLTTEEIFAFYKDIPYATWDHSTIKKKLNPAFAIGADGELRESMLQCVLGMKRYQNNSEGLRWFDIKRYGIEIWRRTMQPDPQAGQYDAGLKPLRLDDVLTKDDPRRAMQLPLDVISAGMTPNPRVTDKPAEIVHKPLVLPSDNQ